MNPKYLDKLEIQALRAEEKAKLIRLKIRRRDNALAAAIGSIALSLLHDPVIRQAVIKLLPGLREDQKNLVNRQLKESPQSSPSSTSTTSTPTDLTNE